MADSTGAGDTPLAADKWKGDKPGILIIGGLGKISYTIHLLCPAPNDPSITNVTLHRIYWPVPSPVHSPQRTCLRSQISRQSPAAASSLTSRICGSMLSRQVHASRRQPGAVLEQDFYICLGAPLYARFQLRRRNSLFAGSLGVCFAVYSPHHNACDAYC